MNTHKIIEIIYRNVALAYSLDLRELIKNEGTRKRGFHNARILIHSLIDRHLGYGSGMMITGFTIDAVVRNRRLFKLSRTKRQDVIFNHISKEITKWKREQDLLARMSMRGCQNM